MQVKVATVQAYSSMMADGTPKYCELITTLAAMPHGSDWAAAHVSSQCDKRLARALHFCRGCAAKDLSLDVSCVIQTS